jgi:hypothetical protein
MTRMFFSGSMNDVSLRVVCHNCEEEQDHYAIRHKKKEIVSLRAQVEANKTQIREYEEFRDAIVVEIRLMKELLEQKGII